MRRIAIGFVFAVAPLAAGAQDFEPSGDPLSGKQLYDTLGCADCHGYAGQGSRDGPRLNPPPNYQATLLQLRQPRDLMPPYRAPVVSDQGVADIHTYLMRFPAPPDPESIRLLQEN